MEFSRRGSSCSARILVSACLTTHETHALKFKMPCVHLRLVLVARGVGVRQSVHVPWERGELRTEEEGRGDCIGGEGHCETVGHDQEQRTFGQASDERAANPSELR